VQVGAGWGSLVRSPRTLFRETGRRKAVKAVKAVAGDEHRLRHLYRLSCGSPTQSTR